MTDESELIPLTDEDRARLKADLLDLFARWQLWVGVGFIKGGVAILSQDPRVDVMNVGIPEVLDLEFGRHLAAVRLPVDDPTDEEVSGMTDEEVSAATGRDLTDVKSARGYLWNEDCWRVELTRPYLSGSRIQWVEGESEEDALRAYQTLAAQKKGVGIIEVRRATEADLVEFLESA